MIKFSWLLIGVFAGMITAGHFVEAGTNPCEKLYQQDKQQNQIINLRFKQRLFIDRYAIGKR